MAVTMSEVRAQLMPDEPDYERAAAELGADALPVLRDIVASGDPHLASKAAYLATLIDGAERDEIVAIASESPHDVVRVAVAAGLANQPTAASSDITERLLGDADVGVRKFAARSLASAGTAESRAALERVAESDPEPALRDFARQLLADGPS